MGRFLCGDTVDGLRGELSTLVSVRPGPKRTGDDSVGKGALLDGKRAQRHRSRNAVGCDSLLGSPEAREAN